MNEEETETNRLEKLNEMRDFADRKVIAELTDKDALTYVDTILSFGIDFNSHDKSVQFGDIDNPDNIITISFPETDYRTDKGYSLNVDSTNLVYITFEGSNPFNAIRTVITSEQLKQVIKLFIQNQ